MATVLLPTAPAVTALMLIDRAYALLGYKAAGEALSADDADYGLQALNAMLDGWNTQPLSIVSVGEVVGNVSGISATVGPGLDFDTPRPVRVENGAFSRVNGIDYPVQWIDRETYAAIALKAVGSQFPQYAYYDANQPTATVYFYPVPPAGLEFHLPVQTQFAAFESVAQEVSLAPGYRKAIEYSLAEELAPGIKELPLAVMRAAANARRAMRRTNVSVPLLDSGIENARFNVYSGL
jgi:hypothetical protein